METAALIRCKGCGYDLRGLGDHRCPECGQAFNPDDPKTFASETIYGLSWLTAAFGGWALALAGVVTHEFLLVCFAFMVNAVVAGRAGMALREGDWIVRRWAMGLAYLLSGLFTAGAIALLVVVLIVLTFWGP
jgi:hypothetical protein